MKRIHCPVQGCKERFNTPSGRAGHVFNVHGYRMNDLNPHQVEERSVPPMAEDKIRAILKRPRKIPAIGKTSKPQPAMASHPPAVTIPQNQKTGDLAICLQCGYDVERLSQTGVINFCPNCRVDLRPYREALSKS